MPENQIELSSDPDVAFQRISGLITLTLPHRNTSTHVVGSTLQVVGRMSLAQIYFLISKALDLYTPFVFILLERAPISVAAWRTSP